jgi:hypothetical protein
VTVILSFLLLHLRLSTRIVVADDYVSFEQQHLMSIYSIWKFGISSINNFTKALDGSPDVSTAVSAGSNPCSGQKPVSFGGPAELSKVGKHVADQQRA